jgi:hypothetical protein
MIESRRRAYLEVMGYDIWSARPPEPESNRLIIQQGEGDTLLVCSSPGAATSLFAGDVARAMGERVVWAWQDPDGRPESATLEEAVGQYLFTRVVLFGAGLALQLFNDEAPLVLGSARILVAAGLEDLAVPGTAKLEFWNQISGNNPGN